MCTEYQALRHKSAVPRDTELTYSSAAFTTSQGQCLWLLVVNKKETWEEFTFRSEYWQTFVWLSYHVSHKWMSSQTCPSWSGTHPSCWLWPSRHCLQLISSTSHICFWWSSGTVYSWFLELLVQYVNNSFYSRDIFCPWVWIFSFQYFNSSPLSVIFSQALCCILKLKLISIFPQQN